MRLFWAREGEAARGRGEIRGEEELGGEEQEKEGLGEVGAEVVDVIMLLEGEEGGGEGERLREGELAEGELGEVGGEVGGEFGVGEPTEGFGIKCLLKKQQNKKQ